MRPTARSVRRVATRGRAKLRKAGRQAGYLWQDAVDVLLRRRENMSPPRRLRWFVGSEFTNTGERFVRMLVDEAGLRRDHAVLDVGCGIGRMAIPLTRHLGPDGRYEGFDIVPSGIAWCQRNISPRFPNFRFQVADVYNASYHRNGRHAASEYRFPYADASFDFAFAASVFTHMLPADVENYVRETARVLKPGATAVSTFFLIDTGTEELMEAGRARFNFRFRGDGYRTVNERLPEHTVAYEVAAIRELYERSGMTLSDPIRFGSWRGVPAPDGQDVVSAKRRA